MRAIFDLNKGFIVIPRSLNEELKQKLKLEYKGDRLITAIQFNIFPKANVQVKIRMTLEEISGDIQRNIDFHQSPNKALNRLIDKYKSFANEDEAYLDRLDELLSEFTKLF